MKIKTCFLFIIVALLLAAADPFTHLRGKIKTIYMDKWGDTLTYHYDKNGRIAGIAGGHGYNTSYTCIGNTIIAATKGGSIVTMFLNSRGVVDSLTDVDTNRKITSAAQEGFPDNEMFSLGSSREFPYSGNHVIQMEEIAGVTTHGITSISKKYSYDENGFIKQEIVYLKGKGNTSRQITASAIVENGNIVSYSVKYPVDTIQMISPKTGKLETRIIRQGDFIVQNIYDAGRMNSLAIQPFFGKSSKNILLRSVKYSLLPGLPKDSTVTTFKYTYDAPGRVITLITKVQTNDPTEEKIYSERPDTCSFSYY